MDAKTAATRSAQLTPLDMDCPSCHQGKGQRCRTPAHVIGGDTVEGRELARPHKARSDALERYRSGLYRLAEWESAIEKGRAVK